MEVQSGTLASVQHSPSGRQLVPPSLATLSLPFLLVSGTFKEVQ